MSNYTQGLRIETDADGFLLHPEQWNELVANELAESDGIAPLTDAHWSVIHTLRRHFLSTGAIAPLRHVCRENHLSPECIPQLFHDTGREAWRLAGLPNPGEEAKTYL
ncbi:MAG TPA: TusE/DsrC/DsvC family sulfur relay protein [Thiobacillus sp.]